MTATQEQAPRTPPRFAIRIAWMLHRAAYRLSRGRLGLSRPEAGGKFGMLRLATVGRRTGRQRLAIVGYFEDGPNLVTLAMNGWGRSEPAWWLNLQAQPATTVGLADGPRAVRARAATGAERDRLWTRPGDFPGWPRGDPTKRPWWSSNPRRRDGCGLGPPRRPGFGDRLRTADGWWRRR